MTTIPSHALEHVIGGIGPVGLARVIKPAEKPAQPDPLFVDPSQRRSYSLATTPNMLGD